jgi:uncharacterized RDD family membrane protein YckC
VKKPEEHALEYAGFWLRLGSTLIDAVILLFLLFMLDRAFTFFIGNVFASTASIVAVSLIAWLITVAYFVVFWVWRGQTPGKMIFGIKIIRTDSSPVHRSCAVSRYFGYIICVLTAFIGFVWIAFDERKQGLHDKIAGTYVVKLPVRVVIFSGDLARGRVG